MKLRKQLAQQIVTPIKDVCQQDINFINTKGIIFASTNPKRVGEFHEIGLKVAQTGQMIEVTDQESYFGTQAGINIPFYYNCELLATIGISGNPNQVGKYALLAQKMTRLILKEHELDYLDFGRKNEASIVLHHLVEGRELDYYYLNQFLNQYHLSEKTDYRLLTFEINSQKQKLLLSQSEMSLLNFFDKLDTAIYTFNYPNQYWLLLSDHMFDYYYPNILSKFECEKGLYKVGIGQKSSLSLLKRSYETSILALKALKGQQKVNLVDDLDLELLLTSIDSNIKQYVLNKALVNLSENDKILLNSYFKHNLSLKECSQELFIHKNTVQYRLNKIYESTQLNPRNFKDATLLYLALKSEDINLHKL